MVDTGDILITAIRISIITGITAAIPTVITRDMGTIADLGINRGSVIIHDTVKIRGFTVIIHRL